MCVCGWSSGAGGPIRRHVAHFFPRLGVCDKALAAAVFAALLAFGLLSTLLAADAAFDPVWRVLREAISLTSVRVGVTSRHERWSDTGATSARDH